MPRNSFRFLFLGSGSGCGAMTSEPVNGTVDSLKSELAGPAGPLRRRRRRRLLLSVAILLGICLLWIGFKLYRGFELRRPLLNAVENGDVPRVRELLDRGADPNDSVFHRLGDTLAPVVNDDHSPGAGVPQNETPLVVAVVHGRVEVVRLLLDRGANPNTWCAYDSEGGVAGGKRSPLAYAESAKRIQEDKRSSQEIRDSIKIIEMLKRAGAR